MFTCAAQVAACHRLTRESELSVRLAETPAPSQVNLLSEKSQAEVAFLPKYGYSVQNQFIGLNPKRKLKHSLPGRQNKKTIDPEGSVQEMHSASTQRDPVSL